jgi:hypothetical protein
MYKLALTILNGFVGAGMLALKENADVKAIHAN